MSKIQVGDMAPDFTLLDNKGETVQLSAFRGQSPVVLVFYPGDETPGCTRQLCTARDDSARYEEAGVRVFGVNQASQNSHEKFVNRHKLTTPLLVDKGLEVSARYDAVMGIGPIRLINRTVVGIDQSGKIVFYRRGMPRTDEILAAVTTGKALPR